MATKNWLLKTKNSPILEEPQCYSNSAAPNGQEYQREGYLHLGRCLTGDELAAMQQRMDDIMLGTAPLDYDRMMMQLDRIPGKTDEPGPGTNGHKGATLRYRKIQDLEFDPLFLRYM